MSKLKCVGAKKFTVSYTHREPDQSGISGVGQDYSPLNGGTLSYEWIENLQYRRYFDVGYYAEGDSRGCGITYAFICGYYSYYSLGQEYVFENNRWYMLDGQTKRYLRTGLKEDVDFLAAIEEPNTEEYFYYVRDNIISSSYGDLGSSLTLYKVANCTRDYPSNTAATLSYTKIKTCRAVYPPSKWYLSIKEDGQEIHQYGSPEAGFDGSGQPPWNEPSGVNRQVIYQPSTTSFKSYSYNKLPKNSAITVSTEPYSAIRYSPSDPRFYIGAPRQKIVVQEIDATGNVLIERSTDVLSGGVSLPEDMEITCEGYCPENTCEVDCGIHFCCYDSNGITIESFAK